MGGLLGLTSVLRELQVVSSRMLDFSRSLSLKKAIVQ